MQLEKRKAAFLVVLMGLAMEAAVTPGPAAAEELKRLTEHDGVMIIRNLDPDVEFQEPLLSLHLSPSPKWPEKEEAREEQPEPPEVRPEEPRRRTGSVACNIEASFAGRCISNITVHRVGGADKSNIVVHGPGRPDNQFMKVHRAGRPNNRFQIVHRMGRPNNRYQIVHRVGRPNNRYQIVHRVGGSR